MSAFPSVLYTYDSTEKGEQLRKVVRFPGDGSARVRELWSGKGRITIKFEGISAAERASIEAHRAAHAGVAFDFDWNGATVSCIYGEEAFDWQPARGGLWNMTMDLRRA